MKLTRRQLLIGIGCGGLGVGGVVAGTGQPGYTYYTYAADGDPDDRRLRVAWYERYNGRFQETHNGTTDTGIDDTLDPATAPTYVDEAVYVTNVSGPVISVGNVLPGDEGTLVVGLEVADEDILDATAVDIWLHGSLADAENERNGPELAAGDTTDTNGELDDELVVELWRDGAPLGSCNGRQEFTEQLEAPIVAATPASVALAPTSDIGDADGQRILESLSPGQSRCVAFRWELPFETATNRSQGDSVDFDLQFAAVPAGNESPFVDSGSDGGSA